LELNQLISLFDKRNLIQPKNKKKYDESDIDIDDEIQQEDVIDKSFEIDPDCVLEILQEFYSEKKNNSKDQSNFIHKILIVKDSIRSNVISSGINNDDVKRERIKYLSEGYWTKLGKIISEKTFNVWKALDKGLCKYHDLLFERKKLLNEVKSSYEKNKELKKLLNQYMDSDDNKSLIIPPYQSIKKSNLNFALSNI